MYRSLYKEVAADDPREARRAESAAFDHVIAGLETASGTTPGSDASSVALDNVDRLWAALLGDLAHPDNALPDALRARLISIGLWMMREAARLRAPASVDFAGLIAVNVMIRASLR